MQHHEFHRESDILSHAGYDLERRVLYLTYSSGPVTIAYLDVAENLFDELISSPYPDVCLRFRVQAGHAFRRMEHSFKPMEPAFLK